MNLNFNFKKETKINHISNLERIVKLETYRETDKEMNDTKFDMLLKKIDDIGKDLKLINEKLGEK